MSATLHLHSITDTPPATDAAAKLHARYMVMQRANGEWSPGAKPISVHDTQAVAEAIAATYHIRNPQQIYGVWKLCSETRAPAIPVEIIHATDNEVS